MKRFEFCVVVIFAFVCCEKVIDLSDKVSLSGFEINNYSPKEVVLGTPSIKNDTIFVPVLRGESLFPLSMNATPLFSDDTEQAVPGGSFASFDCILFEKDDIEAKRFYLIAKSGMPKAYYIQLRISEQSREKEVLTFNVESFDPPNTLVSSNAFINPIEKHINLYVFPPINYLKIKAIVGLSDNSRIKESISDKNEILLKFDTIGAMRNITIEAENGSISEWKVRLNKAKPVNELCSEEIWSAVSLFADKQKITSASDNVKVKEIGVDKEKGIIKVKIISSKEIQNLKLQPEFSVTRTSQIIGYNGEILVFDNIKSTKEFYILDMISGYYRKWLIQIDEGDVFDIHSFSFDYKNASGSYIQLADKVLIDNINASLTFIVTRTSTLTKYWPLSIFPKEITLSKGSEMDTEILQFRDINDVIDFGIKSHEGKVKKWKAQLRYEGNISDKAEIKSVDILACSSPIYEDNIVINSFTGDIFIDLIDENIFPFRIQPVFNISEGACFYDYRNGEILEFKNLNDKFSFEILAENGDLKKWNIQLLNKMQLYNSDFELWVDKCPTNMLSLSIDPIPGIGRGWATANNTFVKGTLPVEHLLNGKAAELTTKLITFMPKNLITAATLFLGKMEMSPLELEIPKKMTKFGIPFTASPIAIRIDAKYEPGETYQQSKKISGTGIGAKYELENLPGNDEGHIWIELIHWNGSGKLDYSGDPIEGVHVLARGEHIFKGKTEWQQLRINLDRKSDFDKYKPTHFVVVMTSSLNGHLFAGAIGSKLCVDNFELIY